MQIEGEWQAKGSRVKGLRRGAKGGTGRNVRVCVRHGGRGRGRGPGSYGKAPNATEACIRGVLLHVLPFRQDTMQSSPVGCQRCGARVWGSTTGLAEATRCGWALCRVGSYLMLQQ